MPKGAKKRAKLKKQKQKGHPEDGGTAGGNQQNGNGSGSDGNNNSNGTAAAASGRSLRIPPKPSHAADASEDSMESSEEMVTPRAAGSEPDEEERKVDVPVDADNAGEEVMVDALQPETSGHQGKDDGAEVDVQAVVQEPEVKDVVVDEAPPPPPPPVVQEPEAPSEVPVVEPPSEVPVVEPPSEVPVVEPPSEVPVVEAPPEVPVVEVAEAPLVETPEAPVVDVPEVKLPEVQREVAKVHSVPEPEPKVDETPAPPVEVKDGNVAVKDSTTEVSRSREVDVRTTEQARGPAAAVAAAPHRATWWNCCGIFDALSGSER